MDLFCEKRTKIWKYKYLLIFWDQKELCCLSREIWKTGGKNNLCKHWTSKFRIDLYTFRDGTKHLHILCKCLNTTSPSVSTHHFINQCQSPIQSAISYWADYQEQIERQNGNHSELLQVKDPAKVASQRGVDCIFHLLPESYCRAVSSN